MRHDVMPLGRDLGPTLARPARRVIEAVSAESGVPVRDLLGRARTWDVSRWRWVAMRCLRERHGLSTPQIARLFGRDHTTVLHGLSALAGEMTPELRAAIDRIIDAADLAGLPDAARSPLAEAQDAVARARGAVAQALAALDAGSAALAAAEDGISAARGAVGPGREAA